MKKINNKGELLTLSIIILFILIGTIVYIQESSQKKQFFIGDNVTKKLYNPHSTNPECDMDSISIDTNNIEIFKSPKKALKENYTFHEFCK